MTKMVKLFAALPLAVALLTPCALFADDHDHDHDRDHRYYDSEHKDYHHWDEHEDRAWHRYWDGQHHGYVDWNHANERQRQAYWHWRHEHPDNILFGVEVR